MRIPPIRRLIEQRDRLIDERDALRRNRAQLRTKISQRDNHIDALERQAGDLTDKLTDATTGRPGLRYVFIVSYGRSGSTLLQGILCSIPGFVIRGENGAALYRLFDYDRTITKHQRAHLRSVPLETTNPWYGIDLYSSKQALPRMRALALATLLQPAQDTRVVGFKEIRWWQDDWREYLAFIAELFPGAKFILSTRDHSAVVVSKWWADNPDALTVLQDYEHRISEMSESLGDAAYRVHYDDYVSNPEALVGLFNWLGEAIDLRRIHDVMAVRHSY